VGASPTLPGSEGQAGGALPPRLARAAAVYRLVAVFVLNTIVVCALGLGAWMSYRAIAARLRAPAPNPVVAKYHRPLGPVYPGLSEDEINLMLRETWGRPYAFESFTQFKERPYAGRYVTVHEAGFRQMPGQAAWPPEPGRWNVFVFGGSSTFGYGVRDQDTVVAHLQSRLERMGLPRPPALYNFGRGHYYSSQERVLFEKLLERGFRPDLALFIDGLNDFSFTDEPAFTPELSQCVDDGWRRQFGMPVTPPGAKPAGFLSLAGVDAGHLGPVEMEGAANAVIDRYLRNKRLIEGVGAAVGTATVFAWQPIPLYGYDLKSHPFQGPELERHRIAARGYELMAKRRGVERLGDDFLWCADIQAGITEPLYVDAVHYGDRLTDLLAAKIAAGLAPRWLPPDAVGPHSTPGPRSR
jgi:hypothetical protein